MSVPSTTDQEQHTYQRLRDIAEGAGHATSHTWRHLNFPSALWEVALGNGYVIEMTRTGSSPALDSSERAAMEATAEFFVEFDPARISNLLDELEQMRSAKTAEQERQREFYNNLARTYSTVSIPWPSLRDMFTKRRNKRKL